VDKRSYFFKLDLVIILIGLVLSLDVFAGSVQTKPGEFRPGSQAPINFTRRLETAIGQLPGIRKADAKLYGSSAVIQLWFEAAVRQDQAIYLDEKVKQLTGMWDKNIIHCRVKNHYGIASNDFRPY